MRREIGAPGPHIRNPLDLSTLTHASLPAMIQPRKIGYSCCFGAGERMWGRALGSGL